MQYRIYEDFFKDVEKTLNRIGKKCAKHGNPFTFEVVGTEIQEIEDEKTMKTNYYKFIIVEVEGTAKVDDYEFVAVLENHNHGNIIRKINNDIEIPNRFKFTDNICEHCNSKRRRNELYIIRNIKTGEFKQVGSNCLMLYTNGLNAEYIASYINGITELEEFDGFIGGGERVYYSVEDVIRYSIGAIDKIGYFNANSSFPTKSLVSCIMSSMCGIEEVNKILNRNHFNVEFNKKDFTKEDIEDKIDKVIEYYLSLENNNDFINNVQVILKEKYVEPHNLGFICYLPQGYYKHIKNEIQRAEQNLINKKSEYFGEIGKRYKAEKVYEAECITWYETMYGIINIYKFVLENGNILIWKTSNCYCDDELKNCEEITFTIKDHKEYKGTKQTEVTRCKLNIKED